MGRAQHKKEGKKQAHTSHAKPVAQGVNSVGRSRSAHVSQRWRHIKKAKDAAAGNKDQKQAVKLEKPAQSFITPAASADKKAKARPSSESKWYAADDVKKPIASRKHHHRQTVLRKSITPGTVLIVLAGRFQGKRVVFLKQLPSGLLLVTGPYKYNGVPIRRVNQSYVISTSTKIDVSSIDVKNIGDAFFAKKKSADDKKKAAADFLESKDKKDKKKKAVVADARKAEQKRVDSALIAIVNKTPLLKQYLKAKFSLHKGEYPHQLKF
jgi:large subunit ribosomal protein L6e